MLRNKGFLIDGFCITPSILCGQLQANGVPSHRIWSLLNPNDRQDVVLGYSLLKEIWSLPPDLKTSNYMFGRAHNALKCYGKFTRNLIMPYICVDLDLDEQLIHLSTVAHMAFYLYTNNGAKTSFMPNKSYVDLIIMIKNVYFCIAKFKKETQMENSSSFSWVLTTSRAFLASFGQL